MIRVENVSMEFGRHRVVDGVSFEVAAGRTLGLLGPNGAGKTTLMRMITGFLPPTEGRVLVAGLDMLDQPGEVKRRIGYLPETPPLYHDLSVREYLGFAARLRGLRGGEVAAGVRRVAEECGIGDKLERLTGNLSKGYRQRVGLAQALVHEPDILVLDEPTAGLDPRQIVEIRDLIRCLGRERTVIFSSHILPEITAICDEVAILQDGRLRLMGNLDELTAGGPEGAVIRLEIAEAREGFSEELRGIPGVLDVRGGGTEFSLRVSAGTDPRPSVAEAVHRAGIGLLTLHRGASTLEDIFLDAVSGASGPVSERRPG